MRGFTCMHGVWGSRVDIQCVEAAGKRTPPQTGDTHSRPFDIQYCSGKRVESAPFPQRAEHGVRLMAALHVPGRCKLHAVRYTRSPAHLCSRQSVVSLRAYTLHVQKCRALSKYTACRKNWAHCRTEGELLYRLQIIGNPQLCLDISLLRPAWAIIARDVVEQGGRTPANFPKLAQPCWPSQSVSDCGRVCLKSTSREKAINVWNRRG